MIAVYVHGLRSDLEEEKIRKIEDSLADTVANIPGIDTKKVKCCLVPGMRKVRQGEENILIETSNIPGWLFGRKDEISSSLKSTLRKILPDAFFIECIIR